MGHISEKKNITIAFDIEDYNYLEQLKDEFSMKSFTQTFLYILNFYRDYFETIKELEEQEQDVDEQLTDVREVISQIRASMVTQDELEYLKTNIDLLVQKQGLIEPLVKTIDSLKEQSATKSEINLLKEQVSNITTIVSALVDNRLEEGDAALKENKTIKSLLKAKKNLEK